MKFKNIIVSKKSNNSTDLYDIIYSNITVVNLLREQEVKDEQIHEDSLLSYYIDYYLAENNNGGFSQFVYNSKWNHDINAKIELGLQRIGALKHLEYFQKQKNRVDSLHADEIEKFFESDYFDENPTRDKLENDSYFDIQEDLIELNGNWLKKHAHLKVLTIEDMFQEIEKHIGRKVER